MVRIIKHAHTEFLHEQAQQSRIRGELRREAADFTERRRQQYHGDREQRRLLREEARAILKRKAANDPKAPTPRVRRKTKRYEP